MQGALEDGIDKNGSVVGGSGVFVGGERYKHRNADIDW
jgi:hypothetical protein